MDGTSSAEWGCTVTITPSYAACRHERLVITGGEMSDRTVCDHYKQGYCAECEDNAAKYKREWTEVKISELIHLRAENERYREALEKLARLGNGEQYGNSAGNDIARSALKGDNHDKGMDQRTMARVRQR